jgi:hypothetical protein
VTFVQWAFRKITSLPPPTIMIYMEDSTYYLFFHQLGEYLVGLIVSIPERIHFLRSGS